LNGKKGEKRSEAMLRKGKRKGREGDLLERDAVERLRLPSTTGKFNQDPLYYSTVAGGRQKKQPRTSQSLPKGKEKKREEGETISPKQLAAAPKGK